MAGYRARKLDIIVAVAAHGIDPKPRIIAAQTALSLRTVEKMLAGDRVSARTMAEIMRLVGATVTDDLFERLDADEDETAPIALRAVR